ncbi:hypothetical protein ACTXJ1_07450 [Brachybacterium alimentarium]|uniref:hypothetical protein n=1 Tax=Brachybacterium alimentarium TaxID=47845 RepID=UPI003FD1B26E
MDPFRQPVRPAIWAAALSALLGAGGLIMQLVGLVSPDAVVNVDVVPASIVLAFLAFLAIAGALLALGLGVATLVLAIVVTVRGRGPLRRGGIVLLVAWALSLSVSFSASGDVSGAAAAVSRAAGVLETVVDLLQSVLLLVGAVVLLRGVAEVRRQREAVGEV